jgi:hypothetical protein
MNLYMKHNEYMDKKHRHMYEDRYLLISEKKREILYIEENEKWRKRFARQRRRQK